MDKGVVPRGEVGTHLHKPDRRIDRDPPPPEHIHLNPRPKVSPRNIYRPRHAPKRRVTVGDAPSLAAQKARAAPIVLSLPSQQDLPDPLAIRVERSHRSTPPPKRFPTRTNCFPTGTTTLQSFLNCQTPGGNPRLGALDKRTKTNFRTGYFYHGKKSPDFACEIFNFTIALVLRRSACRWEKRI